ncbi:NAD-dependent epimerase/dehydratase family protein [Nonomuraea sp. ZG12]|uniref:NAD-dependent epimerase/dehydratase family protein n=1 Tax=Nonomuraea sp. ZG12 TaxID=3452207 RepID=UPI003F8C16A5
MRVFVAGGAGVLGRRLVPQLVARGHQVTATTTSTAKLGLLERLRTEGTDHLLAAAEAVGVVHFVAQSYAAWNGIRKGGWVKTEQDPLDPASTGKGGGYSSWLHLDDAASATVLAVERQARGVFNIVDDEPAPAREWLPYLATCAGAKRPMRVPTWLARPLAGETTVTMMTEGRGFSNAKAKRELGWKLRYPSWRQGFKEVLA